MSAVIPDMTTIQAPAKPRLWPVLATLFFGSFVGMYHVVSLNVSLPGFITIFDTELRTVQWILTGFSLASGVIVPVSGYAGDRFGGKRLFLFCLAGITISSILCALSWNIYALVGFRIVQGLFCGLIQPVSLAMIYQLVPSDKQPFAISIWSFSTVLGTAIAPSVSGWLQSYDWHLIFLVTVQIGIFVFIIGCRLLPINYPNRRAKLDFPGLLLAAVASLAVLLLFGNMQQWGMHSALTWICLTIGLGCGIAFVLHQLRTPVPLLQLKLFRNTIFTASLAVSLVLSVGLYSGIYFIPLFLGEIEGLSSFHIGLLFLPAALCLTCATLLSGHLYAKLGPVKLVVAGSIILIVTTYHFSHLKPGTSISSIMLWLALRNIGTGLAMTPATNAGMMAISKELSGHASALINWLRQVFTAMTLGLFTSFFYARLQHHQSRLHEQPITHSEDWIYTTAYTTSVNDALLIASTILTIALPLTLLLRRKKSGQTSLPS